MHTKLYHQSPVLHSNSLFDFQYSDAASFWVQVVWCNSLSNVIFFPFLMIFLFHSHYQFVYAISKVTNCRRCLSAHKNTSNDEICRLSWLWIYSLQKNRLLLLLVFFLRSQFPFALRLTEHWTLISCILVCTPTGYSLLACVRDGFEYNIE